MPTTRKRLLTACLCGFFLLLGGCSQEEPGAGGQASGSNANRELTDEEKLDQWKLADWLHDLDEANRILTRAYKEGAWGPDNEALERKTRRPQLARHYARNTVRFPLQHCYGRGPDKDNWYSTVNTDHTCVDEAGFKRGQLYMQEGDLQRMEQWQEADWLHDLDAAKRVLEASARGDFGPPTEDSDRKLRIIWRATSRVSSMALEKCFEKGGDTAHTDHACLDAAGFKRSR
jgi:hypothetical protein